MHRRHGHCEVLILPGIRCLSDKEIEGLLAYAKKGGRLVVTGEAGRSDEWNAERFTSPLMDAFSAHPADYPHVVRRETPDALDVAEIGWSSRLSAPKDGGRALVADLEKTGWQAPVRVRHLPPTVFAEYKKTATGYAVHLLNYNPEKPVTDFTVDAPQGAKTTLTVPFESQIPAGGAPSFRHYLLVEVFR